MTSLKKADAQAAAAVLRQILAKVDAGELDGSGRRGGAVAARIDSAALGLEVASGGIAMRDP